MGKKKSGKVKTAVKKEELTKEKLKADRELQRLNTKLTGLKCELAELKKKEQGYWEQLKMWRQVEHEEGDGGFAGEVVEVAEENKKAFLCEERGGMAIPFIVGEEDEVEEVLDAVPGMMKKTMESFKHVMLFRIGFGGDTGVELTAHLRPSAQIAVRTVHHICGTGNFQALVKGFDEKHILQDVVGKLMSSIDVPWDWSEVAVLLRLDSFEASAPLLPRLLTEVIWTELMQASPYFLLPVIAIKPQQDFLDFLLSLKPPKAFISASRPPTKSEEEEEEEEEEEDEEEEEEEEDEEDF